MLQMKLQQLSAMLLAVTGAHEGESPLFQMGDVHADAYLFTCQQLVCECIDLVPEAAAA